MRDNTLARASVNSRLVVGWGAVRFTGPSWSCSKSHSRAATSSSSVIQLHHWDPGPNRPPRPSRKRGSSFGNAPPMGDKTIPLRANATLTPAIVASAAAASQSWHTVAKKSDPGPVCSVTVSPPRSP